MARAIIMPRQGQSVESCIISEWHVKEGQSVKSGDILFTYETDKATFEEAAPEDGTILAIFFQEGDDVPCLLNVCVIGKEGEDYAEFKPSEGGSSEASDASSISEGASQKEAATQESSAVSANQGAPKDISEIEKMAMSPRARNLAERQHADLRYAEGSGPNKRIIERDIEKLLQEGHAHTSAVGDVSSGTLSTGIGGRTRVSDLQHTGIASAPQGFFEQGLTEPEFYDEKLSNIRKVIARKMHESISEMAQLTLHTTFDATNIINLRNDLKKAKERGLEKSLPLAILEKVPTFNDIILYAVSRVLKHHPIANAHFLGDSIRYFNRVHLGVAVDTPRGLMVPVIRNADLKPMALLSKETREMAEACQAGTINPDSLRGGTITITNLGTLGIEHFTPVNNPPETCILGVGSLVTRVREVNGSLEGYQSMGLSLTIDHRALDGAPGARFLNDLVKTLENFSFLLMNG